MNPLESIKHDSVRVPRSPQQRRKIPNLDLEKYREEIRQLIFKSVKYLVRVMTARAGIRSIIEIPV